MRLETLVELKLLDSSFSSSNFSSRVARAYPLIEIRQLTLPVEQFEAAASVYSSLPSLRRSYASRVRLKGYGGPLQSSDNFMMSLYVINWQFLCHIYIDYVYIYIYIYIYVYTYIHTYTHRLCIYIYIYIFIGVYKYIYIYIYICVYTVLCSTALR